MPELLSSLKRATTKSVKDALARSAPEPGVVQYKSVWPDFELRYEERGEALKEDIRVLSPHAQSGLPLRGHWWHLATASRADLWS